MNEQKQGMAITSLVLGVLSVVCLGIGFLAGIPAIIVGHIAHNRARKAPEQYGGAGMAIAGFVMGYASILVTLILLTIVVPAFVKGFAKARDQVRSSQSARLNQVVRRESTASTPAREAAESTRCVNNMKQMGLAFRQYALDNGGQFPFNVSARKGGTLESCDRGDDGFDRNSAAHFQVMSNELSATILLICPGDSSKTPAADFASLQADNVSYLIHSGRNVSESEPQEILVRCPIHGHTLLCDGSVQRGKQ